MEKDTRIFIWGLCLLIAGAMSFSSHVNHIAAGNPRGLHDWILMGLSIYGIIAGGYRVLKTTN